MPPRFQFAGLVILIVVVNLLAGFASHPAPPPAAVLPFKRALWAVGAWLITLLFLVGCLAVIGMIPTGRPPVRDWRGVLIDQRNRISLSRFQLVMWTLLVVSTIITEGTFNAF